MASPPVLLNGGTTEEDEIPVVDFALLTQGTPDQRSKAIQNLSKACQDWGFFLLVNHGVPERIRDDIVNEAKDFFSIPIEEREEHPDTHLANPIECGPAFITEMENVRYLRQYLKLTVHPEFHAPAKPSGFKELLEEYTPCIREVGMKLLGAIWESLELDENYMKEALDLDSGFQNFVLNLYPPCPKPEEITGIPPHSDHGLVTFLFQHGIDGLEVNHKGKWVRLKPLPNSYVINVGDHMEIISNGKYKSVLHRACLNENIERLSVVSLMSPSPDAVVIPAPPLVSSDRPAVFRGMKYKEYLGNMRTARMLKYTEALRI